MYKVINDRKPAVFTDKDEYLGNVSKMEQRQYPQHDWQFTPKLQYQQVKMFLNLTFYLGNTYLLCHNYQRATV